LANFVQVLQEETLLESDEQIEALRNEARELVSAVEAWRTQALIHAGLEIEAIGQETDTPVFGGESFGPQALARSDWEIEATEEDARESAWAAEGSGVQTLTRPQRKVEAIGQEARELSASLDGLRKNAFIQAELERRKLTAELQRRVEQLVASNKELEAFSYSVSHDLRAPLRAIDGFSRIVLEEYATTLSDEAKTYLRMVRDNTRQMGRLVDDLLAFAHLGRQAIDKQPVEPGAIVRNCLAEMTKELEGRQVELVIRDLPTCQADPALLKQVWTNLLANALKYTRKREVARIEIGSRIEPRVPADGQPAAEGSCGTQVVYFVKDNGAGFDMKYAGKLFGVFQRLHRASDYEGTGVGLAIVQRIVHRHGGRIWAQAALNEGATFSFTLE
jgi:light-regulated signal transduction histidine kinase (bacteriophytochrome)